MGIKIFIIFMYLACNFFYKCMQLKVILFEHILSDKFGTCIRSYTCSKHLYWKVKKKKMFHSNYDANCIVIFFYNMIFFLSEMGNRYWQELIALILVLGSLEWSYYHIILWTTFFFLMPNYDTKTLIAGSGLWSFESLSWEEVCLKKNEGLRLTIDEALVVQRLSLIRKPCCLGELMNKAII